MSNAGDGACNDAEIPVLLAEVERQDDGEPGLHQFDRINPERMLELNELLWFVDIATNAKDGRTSERASERERETGTERERGRGRGRPRSREGQRVEHVNTRRRTGNLCIGKGSAGTVCLRFVLEVSHVRLEPRKVPLRGA